MMVVRVTASRSSFIFIVSLYISSLILLCCRSIFSRT